MLEKKYLKGIDAQLVATCLFANGKAEVVDYDKYYKKKEL